MSIFVFENDAKMDATIYQTTMKSPIRFVIDCCRGAIPPHPINTRPLWANCESKGIDRNWQELEGAGRNWQEIGRNWQTPTKKLLNPKAEKV